MLRLQCLHAICLRLLIRLLSCDRRRRVMVDEDHLELLRSEVIEDLDVTLRRALKPIRGEAHHIQLDGRVDTATTDGERADTQARAGRTQHVASRRWQGVGGAEGLEIVVVGTS